MGRTTAVYLLVAGCAAIGARIASAQDAPAPAPAGAAAEATAPAGPPIAFDWPVGLHRRVAVAHESSTAPTTRQRFELIVEGDGSLRNALFVPEDPAGAGLGFDEIRVDADGNLREGDNPAEAALLWDALVLRWRGRPLALGQAVEERAIMPVMLGIPTSGVHQLRFESRVPCAGARPGPPDCVRLVSVVKPDPPALRQLIAYVVSRIGQSGEIDAADVVSARLDLHSELITDPETLVPSRFANVFSLEATVREVGQVRYADRYLFEFHPEPAAE